MFGLGYHITVRLYWMFAGWLVKPQADEMRKRPNDMAFWMDQRWLNTIDKPSALFHYLLDTWVFMARLEIKILGFPVQGPAYKIRALYASTPRCHG